MRIFPRFIQLSTLTSYPAVLLNRDDSGLAKRMPFGGYVRTRVSSQCLKRHWRTCRDKYGLDKVWEGLDPSVRSRVVYSRRIAEPLVKEGFSVEVVNGVVREFQKNLYESEKNGEEQDHSKPNVLDRKEVVVLGEPEIRFLKDIARQMCREADGDEKKATQIASEALKKKKGNNVREEFLALKYGAGIDAAMFGRFVSGDPDARLSGAVHVAHALTVHEESAETDYFTAVDDLVEVGSAHINATELTSGLFYNYVVIDVPQLVANIEGVEPKDWLSVDRSVAAKTVEHLIHLVATVSPGAKLGSTAPFNYAGLVLVEMGQRQPRTLANAFLDPIPMGYPDLFGRAVTTLCEYVNHIDSMYEKEEERIFACRLDSACPAFGEKKTLPEMSGAVRNAITEGMEREEGKCASL